MRGPAGVPQIVAMWFAVPALEVVLEALCDLNPSAVLLDVIWWPILSLAWVLVSVLSTVWSVLCARKGAWRQSLILVTLPATLLLYPEAFWDPTYAGEAIHFLTMKATYDRTVAALPRDGKRFAEFNFGGMLFASSGVVYDETDQIALPRDRQSPAWLARVSNTDLMCGGTTLVAPVHALWDHYYLAGFGC